MKKFFFANKLIALFFVILLHQSFTTSAQSTASLTLLNRFGGSGSDPITSIVETSDGYLLGGNSNSAPGGTKTAPAFGDTDYWIIKTDKDGNKLWDQSYGGNRSELLKKIIKTPDGGFLLVGNSSSVPSGNKTAPYKSGSVGIYDYWIVKIGPDGTKMWDQSYGGNANDNANDAMATQDGGFIIVGSSNSLQGHDKSQNPYGTPEEHWGYYDDVWVVKINQNGVKMWDKIFGGTNDLNHGVDIGNFIILGNDGNFVIGANSDARIGNDKSMDNWCDACDEYWEGYDYWIIKIKPDGTKIWDKVLGDNSIEDLEGIVASPNGGYFVCGASVSGISGNKTTPGIMGTYRSTWRVYINEDGEKTKENDFAIPQMSFTNIIRMVADANGYYATFFASGNTSNHFLKVMHFDWSDNLVWEWGKSNIDTWSQPLQLTSDGQIIIGLTIDNRDNFQEDMWLYKYSGEQQAITDIYLQPNQVNKDVVIRATTKIPGYQLKNVEFYADNIKIGEDQTAPYTFTWNNAPVKTSYIQVVGTNTNDVKLKTPTIPFTVKRAATSLYRAINLNGPEITVDSITFESSTDAANFSYQARRFENQSLSLVPAPDAPRERLIRSCLYSTKFTPAFFNFSNVPSGSYELYFYVWEDNYAQTYSIWINESLALEKYNSGKAGHWEKLGPFKTDVSSGTINIKAAGGDANISSIEIYKLNDYEEFYRAINMNGPSLKVDNLTFESSFNAPDFSYQARTFANQNVQLLFSPEGDKAQMIRSSLYSTKYTPAGFTFRNVPVGEYDVYIYVWEDNFAQTYSFWINDVLALKDHNSGSRGNWDLLGPFKAQSSNGTIQIKAAGGDANVSGVELWKRNTAAPSISSSEQAFQGINRVYPNPITENLTVNLPSFVEGKVTVTISDIFGVVYLKEQMSLNSSKKIDIKLPLIQMKKGYFTLKVQTDTEVQTFKLYN